MAATTGVNNPSVHFENSHLRLPGKREKIEHLIRERCRGRETFPEGVRKGAAVRHDGAFRERKFPCEDGKQNVREDSYKEKNKRNRGKKRHRVFLEVKKRSGVLTQTTRWQSHIVGDSDSCRVCTSHALMMMGGPLGGLNMDYETK